jgi:hypothetical protein
MKNISSVDFADSSYKFLEADNDNLIVYLESWDAKLIKIQFVGILEFVFQSGSFISGLQEMDSEDEFLRNALARNYDIIPAEHPFKKYAIIDIEDFNVVEVVAEQVMVTKLKDANKSLPLL